MEKKMKVKYRLNDGFFWSAEVTTVQWGAALMLSGQFPDWEEGLLPFLGALLSHPDVIMAIQPDLYWLERWEKNESGRFDMVPANPYVLRMKFPVHSQPVGMMDKRVPLLFLLSEATPSILATLQERGWNFSFANEINTNIGVLKNPSTGEIEKRIELWVEEES